MKAYFEGDKNVLVFKPIRIGRWTKKLSNEERLKNLKTEDLAHELALIATWDRKQVEKAKRGPGIEKFMLDWLRQPAEGEQHG